MDPNYRETNQFSDSFINNSGELELNEREIEDIGHHVHSDLETDVDEDPYYEYNQCNKHTSLQYKEREKKF